MTETPFVTPLHYVETWEHLTESERGWIQFIRILSCGRDLGINLARVEALRQALDPNHQKNSRVP